MLNLGLALDRTITQLPRILNHPSQAAKDMPCFCMAGSDEAVLLKLPESQYYRRNFPL